MNNKRKKYSISQNVALLTQVNGICPLCNVDLFYSKKNRSYTQYELAHIYPLNPSKEEIELLENEKKLSTDVNHEDNIIPLCLKCHKKYDNPRTVEDYRDLFKLKSELLKYSTQKYLWSQYPIEDQIIEIINSLYCQEINDLTSEITYEPKRANDKFNESILLPTKRKIQNNVNDYFQFIKEKFSLLEAEAPNSSNLISSQIKAYYQKQKALGLSQQEIFSNIVDWLFSKTKPKSKESAEIIVSFFVQNCEVFE